MNRRAVFILAALGVGLAAILLVARVDFDRGKDQHGLHARGFAERMGDLESLRVVQADNEVVATIERGEQGWVVAERDGHRADFERLRSNLQALAQARRVEKKTALPEFYSRLGVEGPDSPDTDGYLLELEYRDKHPAEGYIVGRRAGAGMAYVRTAGETQSWMVSADFDLSGRTRDWLDRDVINLASGEVRRVVLDRGAGDMLEIAKGDPGDINFTPLNIPEGRELEYGSVANSIAGALANVEANDVRPVAAVEELPRAVLARYETFAGLELRLDVREEAPAPVAAEDSVDDGDDPRYWAMFSAAALDPPEVAQAGDDAGSDEPAQQPEERAAELNARLGGWAYELPRYKSDQWFRTMDDLLKGE